MKLLRKACSPLFGISVREILKRVYMVGQGKFLLYVSQPKNCQREGMQVTGTEDPSLAIIAEHLQTWTPGNNGPISSCKSTTFGIFLLRHTKRGPRIYNSACRIEVLSGFFFVFFCFVFSFILFYFFQQNMVI